MAPWSRIDLIGKTQLPNSAHTVARFRTVDATELCSNFLLLPVMAHTSDNDMVRSIVCLVCRIGLHHSHVRKTAGSYIASDTLRNTLHQPVVVLRIRYHCCV